MSVTRVSKNLLIYNHVQEFYSINPAYTKRFYEIIHERLHVSLRILDWLVTNYSKKLNLQYKVNNTNFNMFLSYKGCLKAFSKRAFDPFARRERVSVNVPGFPHELKTTVAQLNFFKWCFLNEVVDYAIQHKDLIEKDMLASIAHRYEDKPHGIQRRKRRELSKNNTRTHVRTNVCIPII